MKNLHLLQTSILLGILVFIAGCSAPENKEEQMPPNIVFIFADDLGYNELSCYGQDMFETPTIDKLAEDGIRFTNFYAGNTVCCPSRASLFTGKHPGNASIRGNKGLYSVEDANWDRVGITTDDMTLAEVLKRKDYKTGLCGKWHLEYYNDSITTWPIHRGFDYVIRERWNKDIFKEWDKWTEITGVPRDQNYPHELYENGKRIEIPGNIEGKRVKFLDDINAEKGIEFIKENKDHPFFVMFSMKIPHAPEVLEVNKDRFKEKGWPETERIHATRIYYLDSLVGEIVNTIDELGLTDNTLILFTSDNGGHAEGENLPTGQIMNGHDPYFFSSNAPFKGIKRDVYEGGLRVPFIAKWPGKIEPGRTSDHIFASWDFLATFADAAGVELDYKHDGISFLPELLGEEQPKHDYLYWEFQLDGSWQDLPDGGFLQALRFNEYKAVRYGIKKPIEIYNIINDPHEDNDISQSHPELVSMADSLFRNARTPHAQFPYGGTIAE